MLFPDSPAPEKVHKIEVVSGAIPGRTHHLPQEDDRLQTTKFAHLEKTVLHYAGRKLKMCDNTKLLKVTPVPYIPNSETPPV